MRTMPGVTPSPTNGSPVMCLPFPCDPGPVMSRTLLVTHHFPPPPGGIPALVPHLPAGPLPGARALLRRIGDELDVLTYLGDYTRDRVARALSTDAAARMRRLAPGVDTSVFRPGAGNVRERYGLAGRPVVVCVSRLVPRKGQDTLIRAWPRVLREVPGAILLIVGDGPYRSGLERLRARLGVAGHGRLTS